jgi:hypothetical protein
VLAMKTSLSFRFPPASDSFLLGLHFDTVDGGDMPCETWGFLRATCHYNPEVPIPHVYFFSLALQSLGPWPLIFSFMIILQTVGLLGGVISSSQGRYLTQDNINIE